jgi:signal transduction histidine kinase/CheY-like chemotaxis protein
MTETAEQRVLICTPQGRDAELACHALNNAGFACFVCKSVADLVREVRRGAGAILTVEEILPSAESIALAEYLATQATWSDLPILLLTKAGGESPWIKEAYQRFGNLTLLERPVRVASLISAARSALRARQRQYEIRLADQRKDEFLAMLGHELRNPLAPISAAANLLELAPADVGRVRQASKIITRQIGHMTNLIDDLLDVARVTRGLIKLDKQAVDLRNIVAEAVEQVRPLINARRHQLAVHLPPDAAAVLADRKRLVQVIVNVLNNAAKYTPEEGSIVVRLQTFADQVVLDIADDGIGMSPGLIAQIFDLFAQAERTSDRSQGGLGLGLALVKSLVESHGGSVHADSAGEGRGSCFTIRLARLHSGYVLKPDADAIEARLPPPAQSLRIMVVDDNADAANALEMFLNIGGHQVSVEYAAAQAIKKARSTRPQVCLLDIGLPDTDGFELARRLRAMPETASSLLIAITGYSQEQDKKKAIEAGFDYHLVKPIDTSQLLSLLQEVSASRAIAT